MKRWIKYGLLTLVTIFCISGLAFYGWYTANSVDIIVVDTSSNPVPSATVKIHQYSIGPARQVPVDLDGYMILRPEIMFGVESVTVQASGFQDAYWQRIEKRQKRKIFVLKKIADDQ